MKHDDPQQRLDRADANLAAAQDQCWKHLSEPHWQDRLDAFVDGGLNGFLARVEAESGENLAAAVEQHFTFMLNVIRAEVTLRKQVADRYDAAAEMRGLLGDAGEG